MLWETLERVNRARQQAMANPEFIQSAKAHQQALTNQSSKTMSASKKRVSDKKPKKLSDIYQQVEFASNPSGREH
ncbi:hypothetical protein [Vibrio taketomensis]|uniref:hypothetical protein n=1 Tax=Vibrio taketomensis TaxID=2572923 RepID=UPI001389D7E7|nr:hypothetical protein [Vibrio taketomensis]